MYALARGCGNAGPFFAAAAAAMLAVRFGSGMFMDRFRTLTIFVPAAVCEAAAFAVLAFASDRAVFCAAGALFGLGFGAAMPLLAALAVKRTPRARWGAANATFYLCVNL